MMSILNKWWISGAAIILASALVVSVLLTNTSSNKSGVAASVGSAAIANPVSSAVELESARSAVHKTVEQNQLPSRRSANDPGNDLSILKADLIEKMKLQYHSTISSIAVQASLKDFLVDLMKSFPGHGRALFEAVLKGAFPELFEQILSVVDRMMQYDAWLLDNNRMLSDLNELEYNGTLWQKREALFGEDAKSIWSSELTAQEERRKVLQQTVSMLDSAYDTTMDERIYILQSAFDEQYSESVENAVYDSRGVIAQVLFGFDSVQQDLAGLSAEDRQAEINSIRRRIGFDEENIAYLEQIDTQREQRWQTGYKYMEERGHLEQRLKDNEIVEDEYRELLEALQIEHFKAEAPTIAREESDEFFRYKRPRFYGRN